MTLHSLRANAPRLFSLGAIAVLIAACGASGTATVKPTGTAAAAPTGTAAPVVSMAPGGSTVATASTSLGTVLVGSNGMTLYIFDADTEANKSTCSGGCASNWPALTATGTATAGTGVTGTLATFARDDGTMQVSYNTKPLYFFAGDSAAGQTNGDGVGGKWHIAKP
ncbi:MAG: hypothetical protein QOH61_1087 [Chloroflexota bacterium]|nr:hypothetical protein [Chloroflexota bacterium]